jgi:fumarate reductase flavoprotein subunit
MAAFDVDVLVIGSGIAGLTAALAAHQAGNRRILVAEAESVVGGSSRLSAGILLCPGSRYQREAALDDDANAFFRDYMALNQWDLDVSVVRRYASEAGPTVDWLGDLGVAFHDELVRSGEEPVPRGICAVDNGQGIIDVLHRRCRERGIDIALGCRVNRLVRDASGVRGAAADDDELSAASVVIAAGGFGADPAKLAELYPSASACGDWTWYMGAASSRGDGIELGRSVGADLAGRDRGLRLLHANFVRIQEAHLPSWLVVVDSQGRRFLDETAPYGLLDSLVRTRHDVVFAIFDRLALSSDPVLRSATYRRPQNPGRPPRTSSNWSPDTLNEMARSGRIKAGNTFAELAVALGLPADRLTGTLERYNTGAASGIDDFGKEARFLRPLEHPPFYGAEVRPATGALTATGLRIDRDARVLDVNGRVIPGLWAAGESAGGVLGRVYVGGGNSLSASATMGRVAGASAASWAQQFASQSAGA